MGGHFFCLPIADGECWGGAARCTDLPSSIFRCKIYAFSLPVEKNDILLWLKRLFHLDT